MHKIHQLHASGMKVCDIARTLSLPYHSTWRTINPDRYRAICKDSSDNYVARGRVAIVDLAKYDAQWFVPQAWRK